MKLQTNQYITPIFVSSDENDMDGHVYNVEIHVNDQETINTLFNNHVEFFNDLSYSFTFNETWETDEAVEDIFLEIKHWCDSLIQFKSYRDKIFRNINGDCDSRRSIIDINKVLCELRSRLDSEPHDFVFDILIASSTMVNMQELIEKKMSIRAIGKQLNWNENSEKERLDIIAFPENLSEILLYYFISKIPILSQCQIEIVKKMSDIGNSAMKNFNPLKICYNSIEWNDFDMAIYLYCQLVDIACVGIPQNRSRLNYAEAMVNVVVECWLVFLRRVSKSDNDDIVAV